jgi:hypothetical protein
MTPVMLSSLMISTASGDAFSGSPWESYSFRVISQSGFSELNSSRATLAPLTMLMPRLA